MESEKHKLNVEIEQKTEAPPGFGMRHVQVTVMSAAAMLLYMMRSSMGVAILNMTDQSKINNTNAEIYTWSEEIRGVVLSSFYWGYVIMQVPAGILAKKFGAKPLLLGALMLNGSFCILLPIFTKLGGWMAVCAIRVATGLTQACLMPTNQTLLGKWAPMQERSVLSVISYIGIQVGTVITMPLCGILASTFLGWPMIFYTMGCLAFVVAIIFWAFASSTPREHKFIKQTEVDYIETSLNSNDANKELAIPWKHILKSVPLLAIIIAHFGTVWCFTLFLVLLPSYFKNGLGIDMSNSAMISAVPFFFQGLVQCLSSYIADFLYNRNIIKTETSRKLFNSIGSTGTAGCLIALSFVDRDHKIVAIVLACLALSFLGATNCGYMLNFLDLTPNFAGVAFAISNCISTLFSILCPVSTGFILSDQASDPARWRIVFCIAATIIFVTDIIYRIVGTTDLQPWDKEEKDATYHLGMLRRKSTLVSETEIKNYMFLQKNTESATDNNDD